jgi:small subunit ribosomal protein S16
MLAIRMQRTGRKGHAQFRVIVQEARLNPSSGRVVALLGSYDPHSKVAQVDTDKAAFYLEHGAQPSSRVAVLLQKEGVKLPSWVKIDTAKQVAIKNTEKLRRNRPAEEAAPEAEAPAAEPVAEIPAEPEAAPAEESAPEA